ncbi:DegV family protein [Carboxydothermus ferrireducens]|uniref:DegV family protein with EDD domain n=1 Tax=Carboxydothermus ferrireducens DSM 11255 TaxID=1119529 RepID=A0ABX2RDA3_9THEO|nr:DegV family protein [Carboxydothermus ferrireducens]NYE57850.1 DegV family protein with EDD domain [Carboxydothermus ferrireducens DSM 11255]
MRKFKIFTDSTLDLPEEILNEEGIEIIPLSVHFPDGKSYLDRLEISAKEFLARMKEYVELPKTSQPSPHHFLEAFKNAVHQLENVGEVVFLGVSSRLSGTFQTAKMAAEMVSKKITVIDSKTGSLGLGILALKVAEWLKEGINREELLHRIEKFKEEHRLFFTVETMENLVKGGRISRMKERVANFLNIKPIFHRTPEGEIAHLENVRGRKKAIQRLIELAEQHGKDFEQKIVGITHAGALEEALFLKEKLLERLKPKKIILSELSPALATHSGEGTLLVTY